MGAARPGARPQQMQNRSGIEFVWVPAGSFKMGSDKYDNEKPVHQVTISEGFYIGKYEVTQAQWRGVVGTSPSRLSTSLKGDNLPVDNVSWNDAQEFIRELNEMNDGYTYRLPTEAEWEYACRAGTRGDYAGELDAVAWYARNSGGRSHPVGQKQPNALGLYDMHGNVREWCQDYYHRNYNGGPADGTAWLSGREQTLDPSGREQYVLRGGSWFDPDFACRSAQRDRRVLDDRLDLHGLRVVAVARQ